MTIRLAAFKFFEHYIVKMLNLGLKFIYRFFQFDQIANGHAQACSNCKLKPNTHGRSPFAYNQIDISGLTLELSRDAKRHRLE